jgi:hypothetical protein
VRSSIPGRMANLLVATMESDACPFENPK